MSIEIGGVRGLVSGTICCSQRKCRKTFAAIATPVTISEQVVFSTDNAHQEISGFIVF